ETEQVMMNTPLETRHAPQHRPGIAEVLGTKKHPRDEHDEHRECPRRDAARRIAPRPRGLASDREGVAAEPPPLRPRLVQRERQPVNGPPNNEGPRGTMPKPAEEHRERQVAIGGEASASISAERDIEVVAQPARERDVPATPEVRDVTRKGGEAEVLHQLDPEQAAEPARHERVAAEVSVDLQREQPSSQG